MDLSVPWRWWGVLGWNRFCPCSWLAWYCGLSFAYSYPGSCCPLWVCLDLIAVAAFYTVPVFLLADALLQFVVQFWLVSIWICLMLEAGQFIAHAWLLPTWPNWQPCSKHLSKSTCMIFHLNMAIASWWRHQSQFTHRLIWYVRKYSQACYCYAGREWACWNNCSAHIKDASVASKFTSWQSWPGLQLQAWIYQGKCKAVVGRRPWDIRPKVFLICILLRACSSSCSWGQLSCKS